MNYARLILAHWALLQQPDRSKVLEGLFSHKDLVRHNKNGYNVYYLPNTPKIYPQGPVDGSHITEFNWVFVDCDLKDGKYESKEAFIEALGITGIMPTKIVDSGHGIHAYWRILDLDAMAYLRFQRRLARLFNTDEATTSLFQLMRFPGYMNTKVDTNPVLCQVLYESDISYESEKFDSLLPGITVEDNRLCQAHYDRIHNSGTTTIKDDSLPPRFAKVLSENEEIKTIFKSDIDDRSKGDYRLGHLLLAHDFTKEETIRVLINSQKALQRSPVHRLSYAQNIVDKVYDFVVEKKTNEIWAESVADILVQKSDEQLKGIRFECHKFFDGTEHGFRLTQVIGLCAGVGVGKTAIGLNLFKGFVQKNPSYIHLFVSLEQPAIEIAGRWKKICGADSSLHTKVHVLSNYNPDGTYRNLSLTQIQDYILKFEKQTDLKIGCVVIDHIGVLRKERSQGEHEGLRKICAQLKSFAITTKTLLVIQSQTSREKAGVGDLELFKDAAYGAQDFEGFLDFLLVAWQPLKRCYDNPACPRVTAYKFAKIRFKSKKDRLIEDQCYRLLFDQDTETFRTITQEEDTSFNFFANQALALRRKDKKTDLVTYQPVTLTQEMANEKHH